MGVPTECVYSTSVREGETLPVQIDWTRRLGNDSLHSSSWAATGGITLAGEDFSETVSEVLASGWSAGGTHHITNTVGTEEGVTDVMTVQVIVLSCDTTTTTTSTTTTTTTTTTT